VSSPCYTARRKRPVPSSTPPLPVMPTDYEEAETAGPWAPLGTPVRKPFLNRLETVLRYRIRPVPVTFLRFAFSDQLSVMRPCQRLTTREETRAEPERYGCWQRTLAGLSSRVAARGANLLLVVERPAAVESSCQCLPRKDRHVSLFVLAKQPSRLVPIVGSMGWVSTYPQRLQRPWVLLWLKITVRIYRPSAELRGRT
jgi:hypothetical protein